MAQIIPFPPCRKPREPAERQVHLLLQLAIYRTQWNRSNPGATDDARDAAARAIAERLGL